MYVKTILDTMEFKILIGYLSRRKPWFPPKIPKYEKKIYEFRNEKRGLLRKRSWNVAPSSESERRQAYKWINFFQYTNDIFGGEDSKSKFANFCYCYIHKGENFVKENFVNELERSNERFDNRNEYAKDNKNSKSNNLLFEMAKEAGNFIKQQITNGSVTKKDSIPNFTPKRSKDKIRYLLEDIHDSIERKKMIDSIQSSKHFWETQGSSSANINRSIYVNVIIVRCGGCGMFMTENSLEHTSAKNGTEYFCSDCFFETQTMNQTETEIYYRDKRRKNGISLKEIYKS